MMVANVVAATKMRAFRRITNVTMNRCEPLEPFRRKASRLSY